MTGPIQNIQSIAHDMDVNLTVHEIKIVNRPKKGLNLYGTFSPDYKWGISNSSHKWNAKYKKEIRKKYETILRLDWKKPRRDLNG